MSKVLVVAEHPDERVSPVLCRENGTVAVRDHSRRTLRLATAADHAEALGLTEEALGRAAIYASNDGIRTRELVEGGCEDPLTQEWPAYCDQDEEAFYAAEERVRDAEPAKVGGEG